MSAVTLAFSHDADFQPLVIFGPATPINEQLDQANDWAGKELVPVPGITRLEVWAETGIRARYNFPDHAAVDLETPWGVSVPASEATGLVTEIEALKTEIANKSISLEHFQKLSADYSGGLEKAILRIQELEASLAEKQVPATLEQEDVMVVAERIYAAYCEAVGGKAFNGDPLPAWAEFFADPNKQTQARAWVVAAASANNAPVPSLPILTLSSEGGPAKPKAKAAKPE